MKTDFPVKVSSLFQKIQQLFDAFDPDTAECQLSQGTCSITFTDGHKIILSVQSSIEQIWVVWTKDAKAIHYFFEEKTHEWIDDKKKEPDLFSFLNQTVYNVTHQYLWSKIDEKS